VCEHVFAMRWDEQTTHADDATRLPGLEAGVIRTFDAPEALETRFHEVYARSALNRVPGGGTRLPFAWTVNPYRGCSHACVYCFARPTHEYLDMDAGRDFEKEIIVKVNAPEVLRVELRRPSWRGEHVALGTNTDPYQWVEKRYRLTRAIFEVLLEARNPCSILTKSPLLLRDLDVFVELVAVTEFSACLSIPTLDEKAWRATEPHTPHPKARVEALARLNEAGIPAGVLVAPVMPGINDAPEQVQAVVEACEAAGARRIGGQALFLRGSTKDVFMGFVRDKRPDLVPLYERLYGKGAYLRREEKDRIEAPLRAATKRARRRAPEMTAPGTGRGPVPRARFDGPDHAAVAPPPAKQESLF
jgi:DNA repair photolyase